MSTTLHLRALLGLFAVAALPLLRAVEPAQPVISANIKCLSMAGEIAGVDMLADQGKRIPVKAASTYISSTYRYNGPALVTLVRARPKPASGQRQAEPAAAAPADKPEVLGTVQLPPQGGDFLLLFSGDASSSLRILPVPFSSDDVPAGSCLVWNITPRALGVSVGGQRVLLATGQRQTLRPSVNAQSYFDLRVFDEYQGKPRPLVGGPHFLETETRQLIFIVERTPGLPAVSVKVVEELHEPKPAIQAAGLSKSAGQIASY